MKAPFGSSSRSAGSTRARAAGVTLGLRLVESGVSAGAAELGSSADGDGFASDIAVGALDAGPMAGVVPTAGVMPTAGPVETGPASRRSSATCHGDLVGSP